MSGIRAEWVKNSKDERIYTVSHSSVVIHNKSTVSQELDKLGTESQKINEDISDIKEIIQGNAWIILGKAYYGGEITIPAIGWEIEDENYVLEIENSQITEFTMPVIAVSPESYSIALSCGLKSYCRTFNGKLKIYADSIPVAEIIASIALVGENQAGRGLQINPLTGSIGVDSNVVVTNDDLVNEEELNENVQNWFDSED